MNRNMRSLLVARATQTPIDIDGIDSTQPRLLLHLLLIPPLQPCWLLLS